MLFKYKQLDLLELEELENQSAKYSLTKKGKRFKEGIEKFISKVNPKFKKTKDSVDEMLSENIHLSGNELVKTLEISELKKEILGKKLS
jgi:predicted transcriptional regulator